MTDRTDYMKRYCQEHREERAARTREWRQKNKDKVKEYNHKQYLKRKEASREHGE